MAYSPDNERSMHGFQEIPGYKDPWRTPAALIQGTAHAMDLYLKGTLPDRKLLQDILAHDTLDFLHAAKRGFALNYDKIRDPRFIEAQQLQALEAFARPYRENPDVEDTEAFGLTLVTFSLLPALGQHRQYQLGFSRKGVLQPPFTTREFAGRLKEMHAEVVGMVSGTTAPETNTAHRASLLRTVLFFEVGSVIPLRYKENPKELEEQVIEETRKAQEQERKSFEDLLGDTIVEF